MGDVFDKGIMGFFRGRMDMHYDEDDGVRQEAVQHATNVVEALQTAILEGCNVKNSGCLPWRARQVFNTLDEVREYLTEVDGKLEG